MKRTFLIIAGILTVASVSAQEGLWSLRDCIDYAVEHNIELQQTQLLVQGAEIELNTTRNSRLPNLNAGAGQGFGFGRSISENDNSYVNTQNTNTSFSLSTEVNLFSGLRTNNQVKADKLDLEAAVAGLQRARENLELNITGLYLDVLFKKEILGVYKNQLTLTNQQVENTRKMVDEGKVAQSQLYDILAQAAQNEVDVVNAENDLVLSLLNLSQALNLEDNSGFDVVVPSEAQLAAVGVPLLSPDAIYEIALGVKPVVREAELKLESSERQVQVARGAYWPSLSLGAAFDDGYYYEFGQEPRVDQFGQEYKQAGFSEQLRNNHSERVGLNLSIPIFNRNSTRNGVRQARLGVTNNMLELANVKLALYKEIQQAWQGAMAAQGRYSATSKALAAALESFRAMEIRYREGKATVYEYDEANARLVSSRSDQAQAKYDYLFKTKILDFYRGEPINI